MKASSFLIDYNRAARFILLRLHQLKSLKIAQFRNHIEKYGDFETPFFNCRLQAASILNYFTYRLNYDNAETR